MIAKRRVGFVRVLVIVAEALVIAVALVYLAEYAAVPLVREAGGRIL
jgi:hypothetical protein